MPAKKTPPVKIDKVILGSWYQRTTLHLTEVYDFLKRGLSRLDLDKGKLKELQEDLNLVSVTRETSYLEYVKAETKDGFILKFYEDGLYTLETLIQKDIKKSSQDLLDYYEKKLNPSLSYIFSLGAPTPKVLANLNIKPPFAVNVIAKDPKTVESQLSSLGVSYTQVSSKDITVYKTPQYIIIASPKKNQDVVLRLIEDQLFFREFKDQLERYLNIHRTVWEEISEIKERKNVKGTQITPLRNKLEAYQKTISLIDSRIAQMGSYVHTRKSLSKQQQTEEYLGNLFQYKYETLLDTHQYIREIWKMTKDYLGSAIKVISELQSESTKDSIRSLQLITTIGVLSGLFGYMSRTSLPKFTYTGIAYLALLLVLTWGINKLVVFVYSNLKYKIKFTSRTKI
jgi:hypothetical protein